MGISPKLLHTASDALVTLLAVVVAACALWIAARVLSAILPLGVSSLPRTPISRLLSMTGLALALPAAPALGAFSRVGRAIAIDAPWTETSGFPPPRPLVRSIGGTKHRDGTAHPAIHGRGRYRGPLFPRVDNRDASAKRKSKADSMAAHPAGKGLTAKTYEVELGDTLWDIAANLLGTDDLSRIARYWPCLHRANLDVLGRDPNRLFPGQVLRIPDEPKR